MISKNTTIYHDNLYFRHSHDREYVNIALDYSECFYTQTPAGYDIVIGQELVVANGATFNAGSMNNYNILLPDGTNAPVSETCAGPPIN